VKNERRTFLVIGIFILVVLFSGCVTGTDLKLVQSPLRERTEVFVISNAKVDAELAMLTDKPTAVQLRIENKTDEVLVFITDYSSYSYDSGTSYKLVPGETRKIDSAKSQPNITIAPKSKFRKDFYIAEEHLPIISSLENAKILFGYKIEGDEDFLIFTHNNLVKGTESPTEKIVYTVNDTVVTDNIVGTVEAKKTNWNPLFISSKENRQQKLFEMALEKAKVQYGNEATIVNVKYHGSWSPLSLLFYFSSLGWVENASISADVIT